MKAGEKVRVERIKRRGIAERGKTEEWVQKELRQFILPMHAQYVEPFAKYADIVVENDNDRIEHLNKTATQVVALYKSHFP